VSEILRDPQTGIAIRFVREFDVRPWTGADDEALARVLWAMKGAEMPHDRILQFFVYDHLPPKLQEASKPFCELAEHLVATYPMNPERTVALRKLLEAKDAAVRMVLDTADA
jgi:hypothetical protein